MNTGRDSDDKVETSAEKAVEDLVRASAEAIDVAMKGEWVKDLDPASPPLPPLLAHPTAMMAAATVVGMGVSSQIAGMWLGFMKGMSETVEREAGLDDEPPQAAAPKPAAKPKAARETLKVVVDNAKADAPPNVVETAAETAADDLKLISGIGPKLASVLTERGFGTYAAIAGLNKRSMAKLDRDLGLDGRIERDDWVGQAKALLGEAG